VFVALHPKTFQVEAVVTAQDLMSAPLTKQALAAKTAAWFLWLQERTNLKAMKVLP